VFHSYRDYEPDVYVMDADGKNQLNVTNSDESELYPTFSPDGSRIAFSTERDGWWEVYAINTDGTNLVNLTNMTGEDMFGTWTSSGGPIGPPTDVNQCKKGGWKIFNFPRTFVNQGDCIDFVNNGGGIAAIQETDAETSASRHPGGVNVLMGDGSVRFISQSIDSNVWVSRISLPNSPLEYDYVDARDPNAENKARALFDAAYRMRSGIVVTLSKGTLSTGRVPMAAILVNDGADARYLEVKLEDCLISSWQTSGSEGIVPSESYTLNFETIKFVQKPTN
jgi:prepilin-type processing-associated H-X9-DG protein